MEENENHAALLGNLHPGSELLHSCQREVGDRVPVPLTGVDHSYLWTMWLAYSFLVLPVHHRKHVLRSAAFSAPLVELAKVPLTKEDSGGLE